MLLTLRSCLLRLSAVVGATTGAICVAIAISTTRRRVVSVQENPLWWRTEEKNRSLGVGYLETERNLQDALSDERVTAPFHEENRPWSPHEDREVHSGHFHDDNHHHGHHDQESNDDDDDSGDDNNDDDKNDEDGDKDNKDSEDDSESSSQSGSGQEAAAIQSSVITNLDGVNIGNTITIINIGGGLANTSEPGDNGDDEPSGQSSNGLAVGDVNRSAITSAAVRAFCGSIGCNLPNVTETTAGPAPNKIMPLVGGGNAVRGNEAQFVLPEITSSSSAVTLGRAKWLLLASIAVQLRCA